MWEKNFKWMLAKQLLKTKHENKEYNSFTVNIRRFHFFFRIFSGSISVFYLSSNFNSTYMCTLRADNRIGWYILHYITPFLSENKAISFHKVYYLPERGCYHLYGVGMCVCVCVYPLFYGFNSHFIQVFFLLFLLLKQTIPGINGFDRTLQLSCKPNRFKIIYNNTIPLQYNIYWFYIICMYPYVVNKTKNVLKISYIQRYCENTMKRVPTRTTCMKKHFTYNRLQMDYVGVKFRYK